MKRVGFTMIELVMVIVVIGILAAVGIPKLERDYAQEAADTILSDIRYTQHLALSDSKQRFNNPQWQRAFWKISFESCASNSGLFIGIGTDMDLQGDTDLSEAAMDPSNGKPIFWRNTSSCTSNDDVSTSSENIFITKKFGVKSVTGGGSCTNIKHVGFDHLGRPHVGFSASATPNYASYISTRCTFTFTMSDASTFTINIEPETGYAYISNQTGS